MSTEKQTNSAKENPIKKAFDEFEAIRTDRTAQSIESGAEATLRELHPTEAPYGPLTKEMSGRIPIYKEAEAREVHRKIGKIIGELPSGLVLSDYRKAGKEYIDERIDQIENPKEKRKFSTRVVRYSELLGTASKKTPLDKIIEPILHADAPTPRLGQTFYDTVGVGYEIAKGKLDPETGRYWVNLEDPRAIVGKGMEKVISRKPIRNIVENEDGTSTVELFEPVSKKIIADPTGKKLLEDFVGKKIVVNPADEVYRIVENPDKEASQKHFLEHYIPANRRSLASVIGNTPTAQEIVRGMGLHPSEFGIHTSDISETFRPVTDDRGNLTINPEPVDVAKRD